MTTSYPLFGALPTESGVRFRVPAPEARDVRLIVHDGAAAGEHVMPPAREGIRELVVAQAAAGDRYSYTLDRSEPLPDPASRFQPDGVHGASLIVDPGAFAWRDRAWRGPSVDTLVVYELHVGTFTPQGSFAGVRERLESLHALGVTAVEIMPIADFAGSRNWGYDGVALYAPARAYGTPDDLRALVDDAHRLGLAVLLDVVYNHLGPEGAYLSRFVPAYLTDRHSTPWGRAINLDGEGSDLVRRFLIDNALHWIREYHLDGLRLDATHALVDERPTHFIRELSDTLHRESARPIVLHGEDDRNLVDVLATGRARAWNLDGVWADDFHHVVRSLVCGDCHGYYADFEGTTAELARTLRQGWLFTGETSRRRGRTRGTDPSGVPMHRFLVCLQNHDQIGNRAFGDRLHHGVDEATWRAISTLLLTSPMTPLLFMGQEWSASTPFQFFTDLPPELGELVTAGRREEFRDFPEFASPETRERIPDPQSASTFDASRLRWEEREQPAHAAVLALYRALLHLRRSIPALAASRALSGEAFAPDHDSVIMRRAEGRDAYWIGACLRGDCDVRFGNVASVPGETLAWDVVLTTEDAPYARDPQPVAVDFSGPGPIVAFRRPGAVILKSRAGAHE